MWNLPFLVCLIELVFEITQRSANNVLDFVIQTRVNLDALAQ